MIAYTREQLRRLLKIEFIRFCIVGGTGFVINLVILTLLHHGFGLAIFWAQLIGAEIALGSNFVLHHNWTYKHGRTKNNIRSMLLQFHATTWPAIVGSALMVTAGVKLLHLTSVVALVISSAIALLWNFAWSKFVIWRSITPKEIEDIAS